MPRKHKKHNFHILISAVMVITLIACMTYAARQKDYLPFALFVIGILEMYLNTYWTMSVSGRRIYRSGGATFLTVLIWCYVINQITKNADKSYILTLIYAASCSMGTMFTMTMDERRRRKKKEQQDILDKEKGGHARKKKKHAKKKASVKHAGNEPTAPPPAPASGEP